jgi:hypothetical protein
MAVFEAYRSEENKDIETVIVDETSGDLCKAFLSVGLLLSVCNTNGATSAAGTVYPSVATEYIPDFSRVPVIQFLVFCVLLFIICRQVRRI